jgi:hypothetical protein
MVFLQKNINTFFRNSDGDYLIGTNNEGIYFANKSYVSSVSNRWQYAKLVSFAQTDKQYLYLATQNRNLYRMNKCLDDEDPNCLFNYPKNNDDANFVNLIDGNSYFLFSGRLFMKISNINNKYEIKYINKKYNILGIYSKSPYRNGYNIYLNGVGNIIYFFNKNIFNNNRKPNTKNFHDIKNNSRIYSMAQALDSSIWYSTINQVYKIVQDSIPQAQTQFNELGFKEFIFSKEYLLGVSTTNDLLLCSNIGGKRAKIDTIKSADCIWDKFYKLNDSVILISTNNYFRILTLHSTLSNSKYDIRVLENPIIPYQPSFFYADSNTCFFFKGESISSFPTSYVLEKHPLPRIKITNLVTSEHKFQFSDTVLLNYSESKNLKIAFTPITFYSKNLSYEYTIVGSSNNNGKWIGINSEEINLVNIGYGSLQIKIRAKTLSGDYSSEALLVLYIQKPFWAKGWFFAICLFMVAIVIIVIAKYLIKRSLKKRNQNYAF